jgi:hypothetical protein
MVFEAFLADTRSRPNPGRAIGYLASLLVHVPPVTVFVVAWLSRALLVQGLPDGPVHSSHMTGYFPIFIYREGHAGLGEGGAPAPLLVAGGPSGEGGHGRARARSRRPLFLPAGRTSDPKLAKLVQIAEIANEETEGGFDSHPGADGLHDGFGGRGKQGGVGGGAGAGAGGLGAVPSRGLAPVGTTLVNVAPTAGGRPHGRGAAKGRAGSGDDETGEEDGVLEPGVPAAPGRPAQAARISKKLAEYLRTYNSWPPLGDRVWGATEYRVFVDVCVSEEGLVSDARVRETTDAELDPLVLKAIASWRYRPYVVQGTALPFCHPIVIQYMREQRFSRPG